MEAILLGIDGTGVLSNTSYREDVHNSFVSYMVGRSSAKLKRYTRGSTQARFAKMERGDAQASIESLVRARAKLQ
jgi:hypothetical protein